MYNICKNFSRSTDETNTSEEGQLDFLVNHNGTLQPVAKLTYDDLNIVLIIGLRRFGSWK